MPAQLNEATQYIDPDTGELLVNGYIYIGTNSLDAKLNAITIYSDRSLATPISNPQRTGSDGRAVNKIWMQGKYSMKVEDSANVQKLNYLDLGEDSVTGNTILSNTQGVNDITAEGSPTITSLVDKQTYIFTAPNTNTGPMTLNIDSTAVIPIKKLHDVDLAAGDVITGQQMAVIRNQADNTYEVISNIAVDIDLVDIEALRLTGGVANQRITVLSYYTPVFTFAEPYAGGGSFVWDATSTETDNGGSIIKATTITTGRWIRTFKYEVDAEEFGVVWDGATDDAVALQSALTYTNSIHGQLNLPAGVGLSSAKLSITLDANDAVGMSVVGKGRGASTIKYTGAASIGDLLEFDITSGWALHLRLQDFGLDLTGAPNGTNGLRLHDGIWRGNFDRLYIRREAAASPTGYGIQMGNASAGVGIFDNKFSGLYISHFERGVYGAGTTLSGNTVTNTSITDSYISSCEYNLYFDWMNGFYMSGSQLESAKTAGAYFAHTDTAVIMGGSIESAEAGAIGIDMDANTKSVMAICDFYNNAGGSVLTNGNIGHFYKSASSGYIIPAGGELRVDTDASDQGYIRFFKNGTADVRFKPGSTGNIVQITNAAGAVYFELDVNNGIIDVLNANGRVRLRDGAYIEYFSGGVIVKDMMGLNNPEGVVTANPGSTYRNRSGGASNTFWVKTNGTGNTGWTNYGNFTSTTTLLNDIASTTNTSFLKIAGFPVFNLTTSKPVWALGSADGDLWVDATGATAHTPV